MPNPTDSQPENQSQPDEQAPTSQSRPKLFRFARAALLVLALVVPLSILIRPRTPPNWPRGIAVPDMEEQQRAVQNALANVETAAIAKDKRTVWRFCNLDFLYMAADATEHTTPTTLDWNNIRTWFLKRKGKWDVEASSRPDDFISSRNPTYIISINNPLSDGKRDDSVIWAYLYKDGQHQAQRGPWAVKFSRPPATLNFVTE